MDKQKLNSRRKFLIGSLIGLGTLFGGSALYTILSYLVPPSRKGQRPVVKVPEAEVPLGDAKLLHVGEKPVALIHTLEGFAAFSLVCSHLGCLVKWEGQKNEFLCPCHGAKFDSKGNVLFGPPPTGLEPFKVEVVDGEVLIS